MTSLLGTLFVTGIDLSGTQRFLMMFPLCLAITVVYKTTRCATLREVPLAALSLWVTIVVSMFAVGVGLFLAFRVMV